VILAVDVGGTNTRLAVLEGGADGPRVLAAATFASRSHASLEEIVELFLSKHPGKVEAAGIGVAGPIKEGRVVLTNLAWAVNAQEFARHFAIPYVDLMNDVEANAWGIAVLSPADFVAVNVGAEVPKGTAAVISAGTGIGQAALVWTGQEHLPIASEGGHVDFAPRNPLEIELFQYLRKKLGKRVSYERVLSGPGLVNLYQFLRDTGRGEEPEWLAAELSSGNAPAEISAAADKCALANEALQLFVSIYGAAAGNVALYFLATGGVYLGGGIAPKISARLKSATFLDAYLDKGRLSPLLSAIPVRIIMNDKAALMGAARCAWRRLQAKRA
jgi:glucokinase